MIDSRAMKNLQDDFTRLTRTERSRILCALMRVNYGTEWAGDLDLLRSFFPQLIYQEFRAGSLGDWIAGLTPLSEEPTHPGIRRVEQATDNSSFDGVPSWMEITLVPDEKQD